MFEKSLNQLKNNTLSIIGFNAIVVLLPFILSLLSVFVDDEVGSLLYLIHPVVQLVLTIGFIKYIIRIVSHDEKKSFNGLFSNFFINLIAMIAYYFVFVTVVAIIIMPIFLVYSFWISTLDIGSAIFSTIFGFIGIVFIAMIVGMIIGLFVTFIPYAILDETLNEMSIGKRFAMGFKLAKGCKLRIIGCYLLVALLNTIGAMCLFVGLIITMPIGQLLMANLYIDVRDKYLYGNIDNFAPIYEI